MRKWSRQTGWRHRTPTSPAQERRVERAKDRFEKFGLGHVPTTASQRRAAAPKKRKASRPVFYG